MRRVPWSAVLGAVVLVVLVAGAAAALASRPHTGRLRTPSEAMAPALPVHSTFTADYDAYGDAPPRIGDIVVAHPPVGVDANGGCAEHPPPHRMCARAVSRHTDELFVKRVVAGPGDRVALRGGHVIRNGRRVAEPFARGCTTEGCAFPDPIVVPAGQYLLLGDNRGSSFDSRFWGPVPRAWIVARVDRCNALGFHCRPR